MATTEAETQWIIAVLHLQDLVTATKQYYETSLNRKLSLPIKRLFVEQHKIE